MLPTVLRRWSRCYSLTLCGFMFFTAGRFMLSLAFFFVLVVFNYFSIVGKRQLAYVLLVRLLVCFACALILGLLLFLLVSGVCCDLCFRHTLDLSINCLGIKRTEPFLWILSMRKLRRITRTVYITTMSTNGTQIQFTKYIRFIWSIIKCSFYH